MTQPAYTEEELAALPQTDMVFEQPKLEISEHQWQQEGYMIHDVCNPRGVKCLSTGLTIPSGKTLIKKNGGYQLIDELSA